MDVIVYSCRTDELLLVPSCMLPSLEAEHRYGPLSPRGRAVIEDGAVEWQAVANQIDGHWFAVLSARTAQRLLGAGHPCLCAPSAYGMTGEMREA